MCFVFLKNCNLIDCIREESRNCTIFIKQPFIDKIIFKPDLAVKLANYLKKNLGEVTEYDLKGGYILPGFTDSHTHLLARGIELQRVDLSTCRSPQECLEKLRSARHEKIIFGVNWDDAGWTKGKIADLNRQVLDKISKNKPVIMRRICGHFAICNTRVLKFIPAEWRIVDRSQGYLYEDAALYINKIFPPDFAMYEKGLKEAMAEALALGITSIHEITDQRGFRIYQNLKKELRLRVALYLTDELGILAKAGLQSNFGDDYLKFSGKKIFLDGSIGARTAAVRKPYIRSQNYGKLLMTEQELTELIKTAENYSIQLMIHSIGDRATEVILNAFKRAKVKSNRLRHRLEHLEILDKRLIQKIARVDLIASMQPNFLRWQTPGGLYERNLGIRYQKMNCFSEVKKAGVKLIFGSDCMPLGPFYGINLAVNHPVEDFCLSPAEAIALYTQTPAWATFDEDKKGKLEENKFADLLVLDKDPLKKENLAQIKIVKVFVGGSLVYQQ